MKSSVWAFKSPPFNASKPASPIATTCGLAHKVSRRERVSEVAFVVCHGCMPTECIASGIISSSGVMLIIAELMRDGSWVCMSRRVNIVMAQGHIRFLPTGDIDRCALLRANCLLSVRAYATLQWHIGYRWECSGKMRVALGICSIGRT